MRGTVPSHPANPVPQGVPGAFWGTAFRDTPERFAPSLLQLTGWPDPDPVRQVSIGSTGGSMKPERLAFGLDRRWRHPQPLLPSAASTSEHDPTVEPGGAACATAAGPDTHRRSHSLDHIAEADVSGDGRRNADLERSALTVFCGLRRHSLCLEPFQRSRPDCRDSDEVLNRRERPCPNDGIRQLAGDASLRYKLCPRGGVHVKAHVVALRGDI